MFSSICFAWERGFVHFLHEENHKHALTGGKNFAIMWDVRKHARERNQDEKRGNNHEPWLGIEGKSIIVTGGASGIGYAAVQELLNDGAYAVL